MKNLTYLFYFVALLLGCQTTEKKADPEALKKEVIDAEHRFALAAKNNGVHDAFVEFAAEDAVLNRGGQMIKGKADIDAYYGNQTLQDIQLEWEPEFVEVAASGDLAYTYGPYTFSAKDSTGHEINANGFFHTVWKRQADGTWKFVYD